MALWIPLILGGVAVGITQKLKTGKKVEQWTDDKVTKIGNKVIEIKSKRAAKK